MLARLQYIVKQFQFVLRTFFIDVYFFYLYNGQRKEVFALNERIKELRQYLHMSQEELGKWLGITKSGVSDIEACRRKVTEQHIIMLKMHNVSEKWLRTGTGDIMIDQTRDEQIAAFIGGIQSTDDDTFKKRFIAMLSQMNESEWALLEIGRAHV